MYYIFNFISVNKIVILAVNMTVNETVNMAVNMAVNINR
jgi:hypothetical protein